MLKGLQELFGDRRGGEQGWECSSGDEGWEPPAPAHPAEGSARLGAAGEGALLAFWAQQGGRACSSLWDAECCSGQGFWSVCAFWSVSALRWLCPGLSFFKLNNNLERLFIFSPSTSFSILGAVPNPLLPQAVGSQQGRNILYLQPLDPRLSQAFLRVTGTHLTGLGRGRAHSRLNWGVFPQNLPPSTSQGC